jgi:hypothetical protein
MQRIVFRYGLFATLAIVAISAFNLFILSRFAGYTGQEVAGYLTMLVSMVFVVVGIRQYRDRVNNGLLSFWQGMKVGILIVLIPSVCFGLFDLLYTEVINPGWMDKYYSDYVAKITASTPPEKLDAALKKLADEKAFFSSPVMQFLVMGGTVFIIGLIVTVIASLTLRRGKA